MTKSINQDTLVPLGLAVTVIGFVAVWATDVKASLASHDKIIAEMQRSNEIYLKQNYEINSRLSRIEWKIEKRGD